MVPETETFMPGRRSAMRLNCRRSSYRIGRWKRRSSTVATASFASASARCGPTPLAYWTGASRSMWRGSSHAGWTGGPATDGARGGARRIGSRGGRRAGRPRLESELEGGLARLDLDAVHGVREAERGVDVETVGVLLAAGRGDHHLLDDADRHADGGHVGGIELDRPEAVVVDELPAELDRDLPAQKRERTPGGSHHLALHLLD